jgi:hypothetical protein
MRASVCANNVFPEPVGPISIFRELDVVVLGLMVESLVVIVDRDGEHLFGVILTDHVVVENFAYLIGGRHAVARLHQRGFILLADNVHAKFDALLADKHGRAGDELAHLVLALAAERAVERILGIASADLAHLSNADQIQVITAVTPQAIAGFFPTCWDGEPKESSSLQILCRAAAGALAREARGVRHSRAGERGQTGAARGAEVGSPESLA